MDEQRERMSENTMASIHAKAELNCGHEYHCEFKHYPPTFVNSIRRILLSDVPTVVLRDVEILENSTQIPHEMLKHRVEMLPVNVSPSDANVIRDAKVELRILPDVNERWIYTSDFVVTNGRPTLLMGDRESGAPLIFTKVRPNEQLHIKAGLSVETKTASQVCVSTLSYHVDEEIAKEERLTFIEDGGEPAVFDNFYIQRCYAKDDKGRPTWIDLNVESIGVIPARELVRMASKILKQKVGDYMEQAVSNIARQKDHEFSVSLQMGGHTELAVLQEILYSDMNVNFVSYDIPHPLKSDTVVRFHTKENPEAILKSAHRKLEEYCDILEKGV
jgi:DNA-directed RNA polymerase subunit L